MLAQLLHYFATLDTLVEITKTYDFWFLAILVVLIMINGLNLDSPQIIFKELNLYRKFHDYRVISCIYMSVSKCFMCTCSSVSLVHLCLCLMCTSACDLVG